MKQSHLISLSPCCILRVSGPDALRFLNGQLSNDINLAGPDRAIHAAALNAKGGLEAICTVRKLNDDFLLDAPLSLREGLMARLDRYLIADDVTLSDVSDDWILSHLIDAPPPIEHGDSLMVAANERFGIPGFDLLTQNQSELPDFPELSGDQLINLRVTHGVPAWGAELEPGILPPEAGLQENSISYEKGCYLGQEVISRMKWAGKTNRHLVQLLVPSETQSGQEFLHDDLTAGTVTSISPIPKNNRLLALGFRKRKFESHESFSISGSDDPVLVTKRLS